MFVVERGLAELIPATAGNLDSPGRGVLQLNGWNPCLLSSGFGALWSAEVAVGDPERGEFRDTAWSLWRAGYTVEGFVRRVRFVLPAFNVTTLLAAVTAEHIPYYRVRFLCADADVFLPRPDLQLAIVPMPAQALNAGNRLWYPFLPADGMQFMTDNVAIANRARFWVQQRTGTLWATGVVSCQSFQWATAVGMETWVPARVMVPEIVVGASVSVAVSGNGLASALYYC